MTDIEVEGAGTPDDPWVLSTPPGKSQFEAYRDPDAEPRRWWSRSVPPNSAITFAASKIFTHMLSERGDWMLLGNADEQKEAKPDTVEAWGRSPENPVGGWYGQKKGLRGRFGNYVPPVLEVLGLAEVEHAARNNRMRAR